MASASESTRAFENMFPSYREKDFDHFRKSEHGLNISKEFKKKLIGKINFLLEWHEKEYDYNWTDSSVYTGTSGVALMYLHLYTSYEAATSKMKNAYLKKAITIMQSTLDNLRHRSVSFLGGDAGPLAVGAVVFKYGNFMDESEDCIKGVFDICKKIDSDSPDPDEFLFGKVGLLYSLLFLINHLGHSAVQEELISKLSRLILRSGKELGRNKRLPSPLMYEWHNKKYLGAAHGISGILYILLNLTDDHYISRHLSTHISPTIEFILSYQFPSGNFPSSISTNPEDKLVHWCHGAPGLLFMLLAASEAFSDESYLVVAKKCAKVVWERGLLKKGYGLCHGVAGNGYALLAMFNATNDMKYLYHACMFAEWCLDYGNHGARVADRPYSLFEGMAGTIYFLVDMLKPSKAKFPAFQL